MPESALQLAAQHADKIAAQFTLRPMTPGEARDFADMIQIGPEERVQVATALPGLADALDAMSNWNGNGP